MKDLTIYRKRFIPDECVALKNDIFLHRDNSFLVTKWNVLKPRNDFHYGYSSYHLNEGYKVSRFHKKDGTLLYWYCDIVMHEFINENELIVTDLLADVIIYPDGFVKVLDLDELCLAKTQKLITEDQFFLAVKQLGALLNMIHNGDFEQFNKPFLDIIAQNDTV